MTKAHTQGQWSIKGAKLVGNGYNIAHVNSHATSEGHANARLIAAAPELLAALEDVQKALAMMTEPEAIKQTTVLNAFAAAKDAEIKARAAIAKARGAE